MKDFNYEGEKVLDRVSKFPNNAKLVEFGSS